MIFPGHLMKTVDGNSPTEQNFRTENCVIIRQTKCIIELKRQNLVKAQKGELVFFFTFFY